MTSGKVKWFNNAKGYGFINEDGKTEDLFAHYSAIVMDGYKTLKAGQLVKELAPIVGGGGGGRPDFAEAGGKDASKIDEMLARARQLVESAIG